MQTSNGNFNPLHHEGGDHPACVNGRCLIEISIHSTTRVETGLYYLDGLQSNNFNPLHHEGGDMGGRAGGLPADYFNPLHHEGGDYRPRQAEFSRKEFQSTPPRGWRQQYYTITTTILQHISTNKSYPTPSNHGQPSLHTRKSVLIVQIFRCESPRKSMFASGSHQNTLYRFTARGQVRISAVLPH